MLEDRKDDLMAYVKRHPSLRILEKYCKHLSAPQETLALFCKEIDIYASNNMGRPHYEYIARLFEKMTEIGLFRIVFQDGFSQLSHKILQ